MSYYTCILIVISILVNADVQLLHDVQPVSEPFEVDLPNQSAIQISVPVASGLLPDTIFFNILPPLWDPPPYFHMPDYSLFAGDTVVHCQGNHSVHLRKVVRFLTPFFFVTYIQGSRLTLYRRTWAT